MTLGVLVPELSEGYASLVLAGIEEALTQAGYMFFLIAHHHRDDVLARSQHMLEERAVDGIIAVDTALPSFAPVPTVTISCPDPHPGITNIVLNHERAAELALTHLFELGHRDIAFIRGQSFTSDAQPRWQAITASAERLGLSIDTARVVDLEGDIPTHEPGYLACQTLLERGVKFTALFAFNDMSAIGAIKAIREAGLNVPQDVSVVGFDDVRSAAFENPALTTVRQPLHRMGKLAAETVLRQLQPGTVGTQPESHLVVEPEMLVHASTACPVSTARVSDSSRASTTHTL